LSVTNALLIRPRYKRGRGGGINASGYDDKTYVTDIFAKGKDLETKTIALETEILKIVIDKIGV